MFYDDDIKQIFAKRLKGLREAAGLSQGELGEKLGVSRGSISFYENCSRIPDIVFLNRVSDYFGVGINFLMGKSDNLNPQNEKLGLSIQFSDEAIQKLLDNDHGALLSAIIESDMFDKLFDIAEYFFLPSPHGDRHIHFLDYGSPGDEFDFYVFQLSRVFSSILLERKNEVTEYFYQRFASEFSKADLKKKHFLSVKAAHEKEFAESLAQKARECRISEDAEYDTEYETWKASPEYLVFSKRAQAISDYVASETSKCSNEGG